MTLEGRHRQHRKHLPYAFTPKQWIEKSQQDVDQISLQALLRSEKSFGQQAVAQLVQIPWEQNITKNLSDEFKSSLPSIEEIETELSRRENA